MRKKIFGGLFLVLLLLVCFQWKAPSLPNSEKTTKQLSLHQLPLLAQVSVSSSLGRDQKAYHFKSSSGNYINQHPNQDYEGSFGEKGFSVHRGGNWWALELLTVGETKLSKATRKAEANRVEYQYPEKIVEWYENGPLGLQQGFTLLAAPKNDSGKLMLQMKQSGNLRSELRGDYLSLRDGKNQEILKYANLIAFDAKGKSLPAEMKLREGMLVLEVESRNAVYPVTIDPFIQTEKLTSSDGAASDYFGTSVSTDGTNIIVGAPEADVGSNLNQGAAYVFNQVSGTWTQTQKLTASDGAFGDMFGFSVSTDGTNIVIAAYAADVGSNANQGAAYVFNQVSGTWTQTQKLTASDGTIADFFGTSVSTDGTNIIVGAPEANVGLNSNQGAVYVFNLVSGTWTQAQKLSSSDGGANDYFGVSISTDGMNVVAGASGNNSGQGAAYVFNQVSGTWTQTQKLTASDGSGGANFGVSVSTDGTNIVIGAYNTNVGLNSNQGAAYVFNQVSGTWTQTQKLTASDGADSDLFGNSVSTDGTNIVVGAYLTDVGSNVDQGAAYVFNQVSGTWTQAQKLTASDGAAGDGFGISVSTDGTNIVVGAYLADVGSNVDQGAAYVFTEPAVSVSPSSLSLTAGGSAGTYTLVLSTEPSADVVVTPTAPSGLNLNESSFTFTSSNWFTPQTVEVTAASSTSSGTLTITHSVTSSDSNYHEITVGSVAVNVTNSGAIGGSGNCSLNSRSGDIFSFFVGMLALLPLLSLRLRRD